MPDSTPFQTPYAALPLPVLRQLRAYALDLDVLLGHLANERNLTSEDAATLIAKLAQQYRTDLAPLADQLEQIELNTTASPATASA